MKISIVTVCYNSQETIGETLRSVASQRHEETEHIVVDGGSRDGTLRVISSTPHRISSLTSEKDGGIYDAMNKGLARATGDVIGFLNSDDVYASTDSLSHIAAAFNDAKVDACYGDVVFVSRDDPVHIVRYWKAGAYRPGSIANGWMPPHPTFYVRRKLYMEMGDFDIRYRLQADYEMAIRLVHKHGIRLRYLPEVLVRMRMGGASNASFHNIVSGNLEAYRAARRHQLEVGPMFMIKKVLSRLPQFFSKPRA